VISMPNYLLTHKNRENMEKYGDYCLKAILSGEKAKSFEEFQSEVRV